MALAVLPKGGRAVRFPSRARSRVLYVRESTGEWFGSSVDEFTRAYPHRLGSVA